VAATVTAAIIWRNSGLFRFVSFVAFAFLAPCLLLRWPRLGVACLCCLPWAVFALIHAGGPVQLLPVQLIPLLCATGLLYLFFGFLLQLLKFLVNFLLRFFTPLFAL